MAKQKTEEVPTAELQIEELPHGGFDPSRIRLLIYGESGAGKTRFASTFPNPLFLDIDDGLASVTEPISRVRIEDFEELWEVYYWLENTDHGYETIIVDSLNEAQHLALKATIEKYPNVRRAYDSLAGQSDYGKMLRDFDDFIRDLKSLSTHIVLIAQVAGKEYDTDIIEPQLIGKHTSKAICRMMDIVGFLYRENQVPYMSFDSTGYVGKDRSGTLPSTVKNATYRRLSRYWLGKISKDTKEGE